MKAPHEDGGKDRSDSSEDYVTTPGEEPQNANQ
jgi:hypothetical protein